MDRVQTGIDGFDQLVEGGLPKGSNILLTGAPGTGKTIFGLQYLYSGALKDEAGLYVTLDTPVENLKSQGEQFGWDIGSMMKSGKLSLLNVPLNKRKLDLFDMITEVKNKLDIKRIVFDNLETYAVNVNLFTIPLGYAGVAASAVEISVSNKVIEGIEAQANANDPGMDKILYSGNSEKRMTYLILDVLARFGTTNLVITYGNQNRNQITVDGVSEFVSDGIIEMYNELVGEKHVRTLAILKMRNTNHSQYIHYFEIGKKGVAVKPIEQ